MTAGDQMSLRSPDEYDARLVKACYYGEIELIDDQFGRIVEALERHRQIDDTIIVYMSDHGELLGDHGLMLKGCRFFEGLVRVPLIVSWPRSLREGASATRWSRRSTWRRRRGRSGGTAHTRVDAGRHCCRC